MRSQADQVVAHCRQLKSIGKNAESSDFAREFIKDIASDLIIWDDLKHSLFLSILFDTACKLGEEDFALFMLKPVIAALERLANEGAGSGIPIKDLTIAYRRAGELAERSTAGMQDAYFYYWQAIEAPPPQGCAMPATPDHKSTIHALAKNVCVRLAQTDVLGAEDWNQRRLWHDSKMRELDPNRKWDLPASSLGI
jgi:hypothetical protein